MSSIPGLPSPKLLRGGAGSKLRGGKMEGSEVAALCCLMLLVFLLVTLTLGCCYGDWSPLMSKVIVIAGGGSGARMFHSAAAASAATSAASVKANSAAQKFYGASNQIAAQQKQYQQAADLKTAVQALSDALTTVHLALLSGRDVASGTMEASTAVVAAMGVNAGDVAKAASDAANLAAKDLTTAESLIQVADTEIAAALKAINDSTITDGGDSQVKAAVAAADSAIQSIVAAARSVYKSVQTALLAAANAAAGAANVDGGGGAGGDAGYAGGEDDVGTVGDFVPAVEGEQNLAYAPRTNPGGSALASGRMKKMSSAPPAYAGSNSGGGAHNAVMSLPSEDVARAMMASASPSMLFIFSDGCGFCIKAKPVFEKLAKAFPGVQFGSLNSRNAAGLIRDNNITGFPTFLTNFGPMRQHVGFKTQDVMERIVQSAMAPDMMSNGWGAGGGRGGGGGHLPHTQNRGGYGNRIVVSPMIASPQHPMRAGPVSPMPAAAAKVNAGPMEVDEATAVRALADPSKPAIVFLYASWCGHCQKMKPVFLDAFQSGKFKNVKMMTLNGEKAPQLTKANNISGFPTFLSNFGDRKYVGFRNKDMLHEILKVA